MITSNQSLILILSECATVCDQCAASCLQEKDVTEMAVCIRLDMECSSVCRTAAILLQLESNYAGAASQLCADICNACAEECEKHEHDHCKRCAAMCRQCAEECMSMTAA